MEYHYFYLTILKLIYICHSNIKLNLDSERVDI